MHVSCHAHSPYVPPPLPLSQRAPPLALSCRSDEEPCLALDDSLGLSFRVRHPTIVRLDAVRSSGWDETSIEIALPPIEDAHDALSGGERERHDDQGAELTVPAEVPQPPVRVPE